MRTLRELAGWGLVLLLWLIPLAPFFALALWVEDDASPLGLLFALALASTWPTLRLSARRLREPLPEEVAEADGRRPVLVLHRFEHEKTSLARRLSIFSPAAWRDLADARWLAAIARGLGPAGPLVPFARPPAPPAFGPVRDLSDPAWEAELDRRLKTARLAAIVLDESDACRHEIARALALLGPRRTVLVMPSRLGVALHAAWPRLQALVPGLPAHDPRAVAFRFAPDGQALVLTARSSAGRRALLAAPSLMLLPHEPSPAPKAPGAALLLMLLPAAAGFFGAFLVPFFLELEGAPPDSDAPVVLGLGLVACGVTLSVMSRRAFRLVPMNELPLVFVAALPWLLMAGVPWAIGEWSHRSYALGRWLLLSTWGAAYATPLLLAIAVVLAGSALVRARPGGSPVHGVFGVAALLPLGTLLASLSSAGIDLGVMLVVLLAGALTVALAVVGASGNASRAHTPLPVGAASAGVLAIVAWASVLTSTRWRAAVQDATEVSALLHHGESAPTLVSFGQAFSLFALAAPAVVVLVAVLFSGRASRVSVGNVAAILPLVALLGLTSTAHAGARSLFGRRYVRSEAMLLTRAVGRGARGSLDLVPLEGGIPSPAQLDAVVSADVAWVRGQPFMGLEAQPSAPPGLAEALRAISSPARIGVAFGADTRGVRSVVRAAFAAGHPSVLLVGRDAGGRARAVELHRSIARRPDASLFFVQLRSADLVLASTAGDRIEIPNLGYGPDYATLATRLYERRIAEPNRHDLILAPEHGLPGESLVAVAASAVAQGYTLLSLE